MPIIKVQTLIKADIQTCFDLSRNIDFHKESLKHTEEIPVDGKTNGLLQKGEWVTWESKHFYFVQHITSKITAFEAPFYFVNEMAHPTFKSFRHEHYFEKIGSKTIMTDVFEFQLAYGILVKFTISLFLKKYIIKLLKTRNKLLKAEAEKLALAS